ncbi:biotin--[acetyl-CoA-carboxylase] ligase [Erythrobacter sp.]|uniref:biotin--[acetyl-CoA-carboxylase] ligase n=1 Tax=Erythrobacter sp. TaxID=1042 RepID=UPI002ECFAA3F|nr:biotin--[acetyl-CoA-carboxylase] ligase [Erythrobacter sp.]
MSGDPSFRFVERTGSTNADLAETVRSGRPPAEGYWLVARRQEAGRGRQGREWFDGKGNFMGSTLVRLRPDDPPPSTLSFAAALAVYRAVRYAIEERGDIRLKWPNDVLLDGGKVSGILLELVERCVVVGIGVNIAKAPQIADRKTAALADYAEGCTPEGLLTSLAPEFASALAIWRSQPLASLLATFERASLHEPGSEVTVHDGDGSRVTGTYNGLDHADGALRLRLADGGERVIRAGDVS